MECSSRYSVVTNTGMHVGVVNIAGLLIMLCNRLVLALTLHAHLYRWLKLQCYHACT